jgi:glycosyltransferase involved in cell wall biosynthesis
MPPTVSVIVPNYNHARFLSQRLESILAQTFTDYELIVLDDASSDDSREVIADYAKRFPIQAVFNEKNSGNPFKQWKKGAALAVGKYLWLAESDDYADSKFLEIMVGRLDDNPAAGLICCDSYIVDEFGQKQERSHEWNRGLNATRWQKDFVAEGKEECVSFLSQRNTIPNASAVITRRDLFLAENSDWDELRLSGDWLKWVQILSLSDLIYVAEPLNYFRRHANTVRQAFGQSRRFSEECRVFLYFRHKFSDNPVAGKQIRSALIRRWKEVQGIIGPETTVHWYFGLVPMLWKLSPAISFYTTFSFGLSRVLHSKKLAPLRRLKQSVES